MKEVSETKTHTIKKNRTVSKMTKGTGKIQKNWSKDKIPKKKRTERNYQE